MGAARDLNRWTSAASAQPSYRTGNAATDLRAVESGRLHRFARVPTHTVGVFTERRGTPRAALALPLRLIRVGAQQEIVPVSLVTKNISAAGVYFLAPRWIEPGTAIEMEVALVDRPLGYGNVRMTTAAHVIRAEQAAIPEWYGCAATFDDIDFHRDDGLPLEPSQEASADPNA